MRWKSSPGYLTPRRWEPRTAQGDAAAGLAACFAVVISPRCGVGALPEPWSPLGRAGSQGDAAAGLAACFAVVISPRCGVGALPEPWSPLGRAGSGCLRDEVDVLVRNGPRGERRVERQHLAVVGQPDRA